MRQLPRVSAVEGQNEYLRNLRSSPAMSAIWFSFGDHSGAATPCCNVTHIARRSTSREAERKERAAGSPIANASCRRKLLVALPWFATL